MKILALSPGIPSALNSGLGVVANAINKELSSLGDLIIVQPDNASEAIVAENAISIHTNTTSFSSESVAREEILLSVSARLDPYHYYSSPEEKATLTKHLETITSEIKQYTLAVITKTQKVKFDLIYAHDWITFQTAVALKEKTGKPFVAHVHSLDYDRGAKKYRSFVFDIEQQALRKADAVIAVSKYTASVLIQEYGIDSKKIRVIHNAVTLFKTPAAQKSVPEKIVLFVGRLTAQKGPEIFMDIAEKFSSKKNNVRFVVAGDGDLYKQLVERSAKTLDTKFHFTGHCTKEEVHELYAMADVYCMPSVSEPFGLSAVEAAISGVPVLVSDHVGAAEILKGAFLADPSNPETFVGQLETILGDPELARKSVEKNLACVAGLSWEQTTKKILEVFQKHIKE